MTKVKAPYLAALVLLAATACANQAPAKSAGSDGPPAPRVTSTGLDLDPFPSTYHPYPSTPTLVTNVTIFDGEGGRIDHGQALFADGKVVAVGQSVQAPAGAVTIDGSGKWLTPGVIDVHSHMGDYPVPGVEANADGNEITSPVTPQVWAEHSVWPQDPAFARALANGGVTTLQILPGSANLFGGRSVILKNVYARTTQGMKFPGAPYGLKMACGENPKRVYGTRNQMPQTRMGNIALDRQTWANAVAYKAKWDAWVAKVKAGTAKATDQPERNLAMETLMGVLNGQILVHNHCYRSDEMANVIDMSKEFGYHVTAFHHGVEAYKIADLLKANNVCAAVWADWYGFKMEAYDAVTTNLPMLEKAGVCGMIHSDDDDGVQRLNQEVAKTLADGRRAGIAIPDEVAWKWLAINPARALGIADKTGSLRPGKMADAVLWNGYPFSVYTRPEKVWIDGALLYDADDPARRPVSDFELGQPGEGDVK